MVTLPDWLTFANLAGDLAGIDTDIAPFVGLAGKWCVDSKYSESSILKTELAYRGANR